MMNEPVARAQLVVVDRDRLFQRDAHARETVEVQRFGGAGSEIVDVDAVLDRIHQALDVAAADLEFVALAGQQRRLTHPDEVRVEGARQRRAMIRVHQHVAARQVDFVLEDNGDGLMRAGLLERAVGGGDLAHLARLARRQREHRIAHGNLAARDGARVAAEVRIGTAHELDREAQLLQQIRAAGFDALERFEQRAAGVPGRFLRAAR